MPTTIAADTPKYRAINETHPSQNSRFKSEPPHSFASDNSWQYGDRTLKAGEIIETRAWPHPAFFPLNEVAKRILEFFNSHQKSRLPLSPFDMAGNLRLDDGLSGDLPRISVGAVKPVDPQPANVWPGR